MPLIERLMGLEEEKIHVQDFYAYNLLRIENMATRAEILAAFNLDAAAAAEYDAIAALAPGGGTAQAIAQKALFVQRIISIFSLAEQAPRYAGYTTPADVRAKLGI